MTTARHACRCVGVGVVRLNALVGIAVTGVVYATVLARIHQPNGWQ